MNSIYDNTLFFLNKDPFNEIINEMIIEGPKSLCNKSKRVSAIIYSNGFSVIETNSPPLPFTCMNNENCKKICNKICVHAEERAILSALDKYGDLWDCICMHLKIVNGKPVPSGNPSCVTCSRKLLECKVKYMYLWQEQSWKRWTSEEFHHETLLNLGLL